jgi:transposase
MSIMETIERKRPRARRSFTPEFKAEIVELCHYGDRATPPDLGAVRADVGLDVGGHLADRGQVDAEQRRAMLKRRRDRPTKPESSVPGFESA